MEKKDITKEVIVHLQNVLDETSKWIEEAKANSSHGLKRNFYDRLNAIDMWDVQSIAEEYVKIQQKKSNLTSHLRDMIVYIFETAITRYNKSQENAKVQ